MDDGHKNGTCLREYHAGTKIGSNAVYITAYTFTWKMTKIYL